MYFVAAAQVRATNVLLLSQLVHFVKNQVNMHLILLVLDIK